jgi:hypothetical protein
MLATSYAIDPCIKAGSYKSGVKISIEAHKRSLIDNHSYLIDLKPGFY